MIGVAQSLLLLIGELDLSVGKIASLCGILSGIMMVYWKWNSWLALAIALLCGLIFGAINGLIITRLRLNSMVATIGMQGVYGGINLVLTKGKAITGIRRTSTSLVREPSARFRSRSCSAPASLPVFCFCCYSGAAAVFREFLC
jgi:ribose/xylose/arabinose/galactoside ABC-type transport system permease subunit